jgi:hypothetical protein
MKYTSGSTFRQALEERIRTIQAEQNTPIVPLRKQIAFERFIARLNHQQPDLWVLKGGLALQLRLGLRARTTKDVDLLMTLSSKTSMIPLSRQQRQTSTTGSPSRLNDLKFLQMKNMVANDT